MRCFACGGAVELRAGERVGMRDTCSGCGADLHVCRNCAHHDPRSYNECREPDTEPVRDRERANRCDQFTPGAGTARAERERERARGALDGLFKKP